MLEQLLSKVTNTLSEALCYLEYLEYGLSQCLLSTLKVPVLKHQILTQMIINTGKYK